MTGQEPDDTLGEHQDSTLQEWEEAVQSAEELHEPDQWMEAWDDVTGRELEPERVKKARAEELSLKRLHYMHQK